MGVEGGRPSGEDLLLPELLWDLWGTLLRGEFGEIFNCASEKRAYGLSPFRSDC